MTEANAHAGHAPQAPATSSAAKTIPPLRHITSPRGKPAQVEYILTLSG
jgi:hypothetical protein